MEGFFTVDKEESEEYNEDESENPKEGEESLYVAENGDLHYVDENGNIFKCREENGEYLLEEQIAVGKSKEKEENHKEVQEKTDKEKKNENEYEWEEILINKEENKGKLSILKKKVSTNSKNIVNFIFYKRKILFQLI